MQRESARAVFQGRREGGVDAQELADVLVDPCVLSRDRRFASGQSVDLMLVYASVFKCFHRGAYGDLVRGLTWDLALFSCADTDDRSLGKGHASPPLPFRRRCRSPSPSCGTRQTRSASAVFW